MITRGKAAIYAGDYGGIFAPDVAEKMIGQTTKDGWTVIDAENEGNQTIWLTIEREE